MYKRQTKDTLNNNSVVKSKTKRDDDFFLPINFLLLHLRGIIFSFVVFLVVSLPNVVIVLVLQQRERRSIDLSSASKLLLKPKKCASVCVCSSILCDINTSCEKVSSDVCFCMSEMTCHLPIEILMKNKHF